MPVFDYQCKECGTSFDIFHKVREIAEDVVCPKCNSGRFTKLISAPMIAVGESKAGSSGESSPGCCCNGACNTN